MRIYKQNETDMSVKDITLNYKIKNVLAGLFVSLMILVILSSFIPVQQKFIYKENGDNLNCKVRTNGFSCKF